MTSTDYRSGTQELTAGTAFSLGGMSEGRLMALAGASPADSTDPVDLAIKRAVAMGYPQLEVPEVDPGDVDPATPGRRFSLTRVTYTADGTTDNVVVMRGDLEAIQAKVKLGYEHNSIIKKKARLAINRGWRPLAVATAEVDDKGVLGPFKLQGFVSISAHSTPQTHGDRVASGEVIWRRISVWSPSLRIQHWSNVGLVFILSCTGFYIMDPFFGPATHQTDTVGQLMGWVRTIHFTAAFMWLVVGATRIWSAFTSSDRYLRLSHMWPFRSKQDVKHFTDTFLHYTFIKSEAPMFLGHNPLQQLTYTGVYVLCGVQMMTGFVLYGLYHQSNPFWALISSPIHLVGVAGVRLFHTIVMFLLWGFVVGHVYLVFRADSTERHGGLSAMVNGGVWVMRGTKPADAPVVE